MQKTVKLTDIELSVTYDTVTGEITNGHFYKKSPTGEFRSHKTEISYGKGVTFCINPLGSGWLWNKGENVHIHQKTTLKSRQRQPPKPRQEVDEADFLEILD